MNDEMTMLSKWLRARVGRLRNTAIYAWLTPDESAKTEDGVKELKKTVNSWRRGFEGQHGKLQMSDEEFYVLAAIHYYGPDAHPLTDSRWRDVWAYVQKWKDKRFRPVDLMQLVFCYALAIERPEDDSPDDHPCWCKRWDNAAFALRWKVERLESWVASQLETCGLPGVYLKQGYLLHAVGVLLGETPCGCVPLFLAGHPHARRREAQERHDRQHRLVSWLKKGGWPKSGVYAKKVYPVSRFIFRGIVGDHPKHAIGFEKGLFFDALRAGCDAAAKEEARLKLIKTLVCDAPVHHILRDGKREMTPCNGLISKFECCDSCQRTHPKLKNAFRIIVEGDPRWKEIEVWKCLACRNSCPATNPLCERCGNQRPRNVPRRRQPRKYLIFLFQGGVLPPTVNFLDWFAEEEDEDDEDQQEDE